MQCSTCNQDFGFRPRRCIADEELQLCSNCHETHLVQCSRCTNGTYTPCVVPFDAEGYCTSFTTDQVNEYTEFFWKYGFVVIRDAVPPSHVIATRSEAWDLVHGVNPNKPELFHKANWKTAYGSGYNMFRGFLGYDPAVKQAAWDNRQHPALYSVFTNILQQKNLWAKIDRFGFMRPTRDIIGPEGDKIDKPDWRTDEKFVHWDQNPWLEPDFCRVQGVLALSDHTASSGGFHCIPGFTSCFNQWAKANEHRREEGALVSFPVSTEKAMESLTKITMRPGSLVIWDSRTPHGNFPNDSAAFRIVQYLTFYPQPTAETVKLGASGYLHPSVTLTELGRKIAGLDLYPTEECSESPVVRYGLYSEEQNY